ncbi:phosphotriesterase family protein [Neoaquamicrobium sediminum]|uniref:phosphotriesterase family protein n=1 Tax=Neoaquamicrobium sediminum TaxID=1849104 RepID=UPI0015653F66|nr:phosphotriesterase [Mesorhizobium sediminum]NRC53815.1 phosphotriesterase [Mesorhizobium sediminum]
MAFVRTVSGDIDPSEMGVTYAHDHIYCIPQLWKEKGDTDLLLDSPEASQAELELFAKAGGRTIYDATAIDYGRDVGTVKRIAEAAGVQVIATAGFNKAIMWPGTMPGKGMTFNEWIASQSRDALARHVVAEVTEGMDGTDVRGGVVKFGTGYNTMNESEIKILLAVLDAHKETGAPIHSHTELGTMALEQLDLVKAEGVDPARLTIAHLDRNPDPWLHRKVAETGVFFSFDGITRVKYYSEDVRTRCILDLVRWGHEDQIMVGGDIARRTMFASYGEGGLGMGFILEKWKPRFIEEAGEAGFDGEKLVHKFFVENPQRAFAFTG